MYVNIYDTHVYLLCRLFKVVLNLHRHTHTARLKAHEVLSLYSTSGKIQKTREISQLIYKVRYP